MAISAVVLMLVRAFTAGLRQQLADADDLASSSAAEPTTPSLGTSSFSLPLLSLEVGVLSCRCVQLIQT